MNLPGRSRLSPNPQRFEPRLEQWPNADASAVARRTLADRRELILRFGRDPNAYAALQPGLDYFDRPDGFLAFRRALGAPVVLGDAVAAPAALPALLAGFLEAHPSAVFAYATEPFAARLAQADPSLRFIPVATERVLEVAHCPTAGIQELRGALRHARRAGLRIEEARGASLGAERRRALEEINTRFLRSSRPGRELTFVNRPVQFDDLPGARLFLLHHCEDGRERLFGFAVGDPFFEDGRPVGLQLTALRFDRVRVWGVFLTVVHTLIDQLQREGLDRLSLGGCALHRAEEPFAPRPMRGCRLAVAVTRRVMRRCYPVEHLNASKLLFPGHDLRRFMAARARTPALPAVRVIAASLHQNPEP